MRIYNKQFFTFFLKNTIFILELKSMKNIEPIQIWNNGTLKSADVLECRIVNDNLMSTCTFYWALIEQTGSTMMHFGDVLAEGNYTIDNEVYDSWDGTNNTTYNMIATHINVTLIRE